MIKSSGYAIENYGMRQKGADNYSTCKFWGFHGSEYSSRGLLGCGSVQCCGRIPIFWETLLPPFSQWLQYYMASQPRRPQL